MAFLHGGIGLFLVFGIGGVNDAPSYEGLSRILPMDAWGILLLISATAFLATVIQEDKLEYWSMILAGTIGVVTFGLLAMASLELAVNQANTINHIVVASIDMIVAILGGVALWLRRNG